MWRGDRGTRAHHDLIGAHILSAQPNIASGVTIVENGHNAGVTAGILDAHHGVRPGRYERAGHDARRFTRHDGARRRASRRDCSDHSKLGWPLGRRTANVIGAQREAVHAGVITVRQEDR